MTCAELESILADYIDGSLASPERATLELHAAQCDRCREFMADVIGVAALLERVEDVDAPAELITRIAYQTPQGRSRDSFEMLGFWPELKSRWLEPLLQPRLAMGMAMTVLSFSMLARCTGTPVQHIQAADLNPGRILENLEDRVLRTRDRMVKNYENLRVVYEIESRLNEVQQQTPAAQSDNQDQNKSKNQGANK